MIKWLAILLTGALVSIMIPMALHAQAMSSYDAGLGATMLTDTNWTTNLPISGVAPASDEIIYTGTTTQVNIGGTIPLNIFCGLPAIPTGTPTVIPTTTPTITPTPIACSGLDVYIHVVLAFSWYGGTESSIEVDLDYGTGGSSNGGAPLGSIIIPCTTGTSGTCDLDTYLKINSSDISWRTDWPQAYIRWSYPWWDGGSGTHWNINYLVTFADKDLSPAIANCDSQFLTGSSPIASGTVSAIDSFGDNILAHNTLGLNLGDWVEVVISGGPWLQNDIGGNRYDMAVRLGSDPWKELIDTSVSACRIDNPDGNHYKTYLQVTSLDYLAFRVNSTDFPHNSGSLSYTVYKSTYSPYPANGCAETYVLGPNIGDNSVSANASNGYEFVPAVDPNIEYGYPTEPGIAGIQTRYLAIETSGTFYTSTNMGSGLGVLKDVEGDNTWHNIATYPGASCIAKLDPIGHYLIYIPYSGGPIDWWDKVATDDPARSHGSLTFTFFIATKIQTQAPQPSLPAAGSCDDNYTHSATLYHTYILQGSNYVGLVMDLDPTKYYALVTTGGPWLNGSTPSYNIAISPDNGITWNVIYDYASQLCTEATDTNHSLTYIKPLLGRVYKLRVYDPGDDYSDNSGSVSVNVYEATPSYETTQWITCASSYQMTEISSLDTDREIPATASLGVPVQDIALGEKLILTPGTIYALDVDPAYTWDETSDHIGRYSYQVSADNGLTWVDVNDSSIGVGGLLCVVHSTASNTSPYRIYFTAQNGSYRIRVKDQNGNFGDNENYLVYRIYKTNTPGSTPGSTTNTIPTNPAVWGPGCTDVCQRPGGLFVFQSISFTLLGSPISFSIPVPDIGGWLEYGRCSLQHYISWCQEDTAALLNIPKALADREPFGTFIEIQTTIKDVQTVIASYDVTGGSGSDIGPNTSSLWGGSTGGSGTTDTTNSPDTILTNIPASSFWNGGPLNLTTGGAISSEDTDYINQCTISYTKFIGSPAYGMCYAFTLIRNLTGFLSKVQLLVDVAGVLMIIMYVMNRWVGSGVPA
jgi:hypothetical protein